MSYEVRVSVKVRSQKVTKGHQVQNSFSGMRDMYSKHFCTWNSKIESILQSDSKKVNDRGGSGQPSGHEGQIFKFVFLSQKDVSEPV